MNTRDYLIKKLKSELSVVEYRRYGDWFLTHIDRLVNNYPFLKIGSSVKADIDGEFIGEVHDFHISSSVVCGMGILVDTSYGNVWYYETKELTEKEL